MAEPTPFGPNYGDAFSIANQYRANSAPNAESVFEVKFYQEIDPGSRFATYAWPRGLVLPYAAQRSRVGEGFFEVHESSYNLMDDNDTRKNYMFPKTYTLGTGADAIAVPDEDTIKGGAYSGLAFNQEPPYFCLKYPTNTDPLLRFGWGQNPWPVYRYSDVLLMYAEAMNEQGMATQDVLDQTINQTRARGGMPPLVGLGQGEIREALKQERYIEFFFEGKRFFDLVRWGELVQTVNNRDFGYTNNFPITEEYELLPLPQRELDANPNLGVNNSPWN
ncbi:MAG: RagB/SusD family nutrient uptake outer membrane protein [Bacteroidia bacterium]|nr:RagB/SusD family nutrient uptake outer membrane protein [Bacteroidia bacterium]